MVSSEKAVTIATSYKNIYAAVGIHPHHVVKYQNPESGYQNDVGRIESFLQNKHVVAVGEVGLDRHIYTDTKYENYSVNDSLLSLQKTILAEQIKLALVYQKSLILHNREATADILLLLKECWDNRLVGKTVFHCCEADKTLLTFAKEHDIYIGVDGDVTYDKKKQEFVKHIPLELLAVETDAPFLLPEPLKSQKAYPNKPENLPLIIETLSKLRNESAATVANQTRENAEKLFQTANSN